MTNMSHAASVFRYRVECIQDGQWVPYRCGQVFRNPHAAEKLMLRIAGRIGREDVLRVAKFVEGDI